MSALGQKRTSTAARAALEGDPHAILGTQRKEANGLDDMIGGDAYPVALRDSRENDLLRGPPPNGK